MPQEKSAREFPSQDSSQQIAYLQGPGIFKSAEGPDGPDGYSNPNVTASLSDGTSKISLKKDVPNKTANIAVVRGHGSVKYRNQETPDGRSKEISEIDVCEETSDIVEILLEMQKKTGATTLIALGCYIGGAREAIMNNAHKFAVGTKFVMPGSSSNATIIESNNKFIEDLFDQTLDNPDFTIESFIALQSVTSAESLLCMAVENDYSVSSTKFLSPKNPDESLLEDELNDSLVEYFSEDPTFYHEDGIESKTHQNSHMVIMSGDPQKSSFLSNLLDAREAAVSELKENEDFEDYKKSLIEVIGSRNKTDRIEALITKIDPENDGEIFRLAQATKSQLLAKGTNFQNSDGNTMLHKAAETAKVKTVAELLAKTDINIDIKNNNGETALLHAVRDGNLKITSLLLAAKADPNIKNNNNLSPFFIAALQGNSDILSTLLKGDIKIPQKDINVAFLVAASKGHLQSVSVFLDHGINHDITNLALINAANAADLKTMSSLLNAGANPNIKGKDGKSVIDIDLNKEADKTLLQEVKMKIEKASAIFSAKAAISKNVMPKEEQKESQKNSAKASQKSANNDESKTASEKKEKASTQLPTKAPVSHSSSRASSANNSTRTSSANHKTKRDSGDSHTARVTSARKAREEKGSTGLAR